MEVISEVAHRFNDEALHDPLSRRRKGGIGLSFLKFDEYSGSRVVVLTTFLMPLSDSHFCREQETQKADRLSSILLLFCLN